MRSSGGCTIQQALTSEAATVVKQAITLAKQRGHAQVTPLHVASTMLSGTLLRTACLQSHSHPLQGRALELCFGVALNRLPTSSTASSTSPMLMGIQHFSTSSSHHGQQQHPSISNALIAAFKRAQAHQRRGGSVENQQQPILVVKIDLQQLIISILDDPSVSRVMKEAGFSSTMVKDKVEQAHVSTSSCSNNNNNNNKDADKGHVDNDSNKSKKLTANKDSNSSNNRHQDHQLGAASVESAVGFGRMFVHQEVERRTSSDQVIISKDDISSLIDSLMMGSKKRKRISHVVVGECLITLDGVVRGAMEQLDKKGLLSSSSSNDDHHHQGVKFVPISLYSFASLTRQQVEQQILQLNSLVKNCCLDENKKVFLYLGDLKWCVEFREANNYSSNISYKNYCPVEHMVGELGRLVSSYCDCGRLWLIGIATFQTYIKCRTSGEYPSLETIWGLQHITIPAGSLALSLLPPDSRCSNIQGPSMNKKGGGGVHGESSWLLVDNIGVGEDKSETVARSQQPNNRSSACNYNSESPTSSRLPSWLQQCKNDQTNRLNNSSNQDPASRVKEVCKRWNSFNGAVAFNHHEATPSQSLDRTLSFSSISPPNSSPSYDRQHPHPFFTMQHRQLEPNNNNNNFCVYNYHAGMPSSANNSTTSYDHQRSTAFTMSIHNQYDRYDKVLRQKGFISSPITTPNNSTPNSTCSSDIVIMESSPSPRFKEYNVTNLDALCKALEEKVPWQKDIIPEIASTVLRCRSGTGRRRSSSGNHKNNEETWLLFQGLDMDAKVKIAEELARLVFGSQDKFITIPLSSFSSSSSARASGYSDSVEDSHSSNSTRNKRLRDEQSCSSYIDRFAEAVSSDPHRVFFIEDVEQVDYCSQMGLKKAMERGKLSMNRNDHEEVGLNDAIIILSCETCSFSSRSRGCSPTFKARHDDIMDQAKGGLEEEEENNNSPSLSLDLNISINDDDYEEEDHNTIGSSFDNIGLVASVDRCVMFSKIHNL